MIYLDHAATSWPKPPEVVAAVVRALETAGGNPGRSAHRLSIEAARLVYDARETVAGLVGASDPLRVVFTSSGTLALNLALHGLVRAGDRVAVGPTEHNSVMRPLSRLERRGVEVVRLPAGPDGVLDLAAAARLVVPGTTLVALQHASNVTGAIQPVAEVAALARAAGALLLVDAAQTAGCVPLDMRALGVDLLAFPGHKALQGPPGTGALVLGESVDPDRLDALVQGGTGSRSEHETQPEFLPDKFESGTADFAGIAGLGAGAASLAERGVESVRAHEVGLTRALLEGLGAIPGLRLHGPLDPARRAAVVSFTLEGRSVSEVGLRLDEEHDVLCRVGLHCAPAAHRALGTFPEGTVRFSAGPRTTREEVLVAVAAVRKLAAR